MATLAVSPNETVFNTVDASIKVSVSSNIFAYEVTNLSNTPITNVEFQGYAAYNPIVPEGWEKELENGVFRSWVEDSSLGILPQRKEEFSLRVSSRGAVLDKLPAKIKFKSGETVVIADVWSPVPEPTSYVLFITGVIAALFLIHSLLVSRDQKKAKVTAS